MIRNMCFLSCSLEQEKTVNKKMKKAENIFLFLKIIWWTTKCAYSIYKFSTFLYTKTLCSEFLYIFFHSLSHFTPLLFIYSVFSCLRCIFILFFFCFFMDVLWIFVFAYVFLSLYYYFFDICKVILFLTLRDGDYLNAF